MKDGLKKNIATTKFHNLALHILKQMSKQTNTSLNIRTEQKHISDSEHHTSTTQKKLWSQKTKMEDP